MRAIGGLPGTVGVGWIDGVEIACDGVTRAWRWRGAARRSSTTASNGWMPGARGSRTQPAGGREGAVGVGGAVPGGEPQLHRLARAVEGHEVGARVRRRPGFPRPRGRDGRRRGRRRGVRGVGAGPARVGRDDPAGDGARRARTGGPPCRGGATRRWTARRRRPAHTSRPRSRRGGGTAPRRARGWWRRTAAASVVEQHRPDPRQVGVPAGGRQDERSGCRRRARGPRCPRPRTRATRRRRRRRRGPGDARPPAAGRPRTSQAQPASVAAAAMAPPRRPGP